MTTNVDDMPSFPTGLSDDQIAALVRDTADAWQMPPTSLDRRRWSELVRQRPGRFGSATGLLRRFGRAAALAVALIVVAAAAGIVVTQLRTVNVPASTDPTRSVTSPTSSPAVSIPHTTGLPIGLNPLLVSFDSGYALVDVAKGTISSISSQGGPRSPVRQLDDGSLICICVSSSSTGGSVSQYTVRWERLNADGSWTGYPLGTFTGAPDPRGSSLAFDQRASIALSPAGDSAVYLGWSTREHPVWHSGLVAVDLASGAVLQRIELPDRDDGPDDQPVIAFAPRVVGPAGQNRVLIDRPWWGVASLSSGEPAVKNVFDAFIAPISSGAIGMYHSMGAAQPFDGMRGCGTDVDAAGSVGDAGWWATCLSGDGVHLRTFDGNDNLVRERVLDNNTAGTTVGWDPTESVLTIDPGGTALYAWNPVALRLTKVDLATGRTTVADDPTASDDLLARVGDWLAPPAVAKALLRPAVALSPDGSRAYALGIAPATNDASTSSIGITVVDTSSMQVLAHWSAAANYESIATSADGSFVLLAAAPTVGSQPPGASITALDATTGTPRATVGGLGGQPFFFTGPRLP